MFGAAEDTYIGFELERRDNELVASEIAESITAPMYTRIQQILEGMSVSDRKKIEPIRVQVLNAPTTFFLFESGFDDERQSLIRTSSETIAGLAKIAIAQQISLMHDSDGDWLHKYMLYIRRTPDGRAFVDPWRASGLIVLTPTEN